MNNGQEIDLENGLFAGIMPTQMHGSDDSAVIQRQSRVAPSGGLTAGFAMMVLRKSKCFLGLKTGIEGTQEAI
jgi:hypothetical protein